MVDLQKFSAIKAFTLGGYDVTVGQLVFIPLVIICGYLLLNWLVRRITKQMHHRGMDVNLVQVVRRAIYIVGLVVLCISLLEMLNVPLSAFAFISGAVAIGIGFGAQNIINNFISGWILIWERPISINDFIETGGVSGTVEEINTRSTKIRRVDGVHLLVPNSKLIDDYKQSYSGRAPEVVYWFKDFRSKAAELAGRVKEIDIPTLVFWGELDVLFDPSNAKNLDAALPQSKLQILPEAGHLAWADQPELFADMIIDWVETAHK